MYSKGKNILSLCKWTRFSTFINSEFLKRRKELMISKLASTGDRKLPNFPLYLLCKYYSRDRDSRTNYKMWIHGELSHNQHIDESLYRLQKTLRCGELARKCKWWPYQSNCLERVDQRLRWKQFHDRSHWIAFKYMF